MAPINISVRNVPASVMHTRFTFAFFHHLQLLVTFCHNCDRVLHVSALKFWDYYFCTFNSFIFFNIARCCCCSEFSWFAHVDSQKQVDLVTLTFEFHLTLHARITMWTLTVSNW